MRGMSARVRHWRMVWIGMPVNISLTPVMPFETSNGKKISGGPRWTCMSHRPGIRNLPVPSTISAPFGARMDFLIRTICPWSTSTDIPGRAGAPVASMTVTFLMTRACAEALKQQS